MEIKKIADLLIDWKNVVADKIEKLPPSGSSRIYYRVYFGNTSILAAFNPNTDENKAYFSFTESFLEHRIPVPKVEYISADKQSYLVEDLGNDSLYSHVIESNSNLNDNTIDLYKKSLSYLVKMQVQAHESINYNLCYPVSKFNKDSIQWDLNYFKYNYLKLANVDFNEYLLEKDFKTLKKYLLSFSTNYFMFRDFQSRNILIKDNEPYFIDFQGGRKGPLTYDVASLLYQAKAQLPLKLKEELFEFYYKELSNKINVEQKGLMYSYKSFALLRTLQVLGAYGYRGYFEKKTHFIQSIPYAIKNLKELLNDKNFPVELPHIKLIAENLQETKSNSFKNNDKLTVSISSFSYKKGIPADPSENGGGFVFDCRSIHNPGRYDEYKTLTGKDKPVIDFFESEDEMENFLESVFKIVDRSVEVYQNRNFKHLMVNFGCTGGQHRSVYSAEQLAKHLKQNYNINISVWHREQNLNTIIK